MRIWIAILLAAACSKSESRSQPGKEATQPPAVAPPKSARVLGWTELDTKQPLAKQVADEAAAAAAAGKKPHAYLHADWCDPCVAIEKTRDSDERMKTAFAGTHIVSIDIDRADPKELAELGLVASTIPVFYRLGADGKLTGDKITGAAWGDNVPENMAPPLGAYFAR